MFQKAFKRRNLLLLVATIYFLAGLHVCEPLFDTNDVAFASCGAAVYMPLYIAAVPWWHALEILNHLTGHTFIIPAEPGGGPFAPLLSTLGYVAVILMWWIFIATMRAIIKRFTSALQTRRKSTIER